MIRYEANLEGGVEAGETYTDFDERDVFFDILEELGWNPALEYTGRGGYYRFKVVIDLRIIVLHTYLKRLSFGGRENRPYEKRAQFSAALDRTGFDVHETEDELSLILALYKREKFSETIICAWNIRDWGYNIGRAFNCFINIEAVADALKDGFSQYKTSIGQIACGFKPEWFSYYLENKNILHKQIIDKQIVLNQRYIPFHNDSNINDEIPKFEDFFMLIITILKNHDGITSVENIEEDVADILHLTEEARQRVHNLNEGYRTELGYRLAWARYYLKRAGLIESPKRSIWSLTAIGFKTNHIDKEAIKKSATEKEIRHEVNLDMTNNDEGGDIEEEETDFENINIEHPFDPNLVDIKTRSMSLDLLLKRLNREEIDLNTSFQRKAGLWDITKQSRLIESILVKFPLPAFYFDGSDDNKWLVVDGLQRLSSLNNFVNKEIFGLQRLEFLTQFNGKKFNELPSYLQRRIEEFEVTAYVIAPGTPKVLKYNVFRRINTGGLTLTLQEIRNALNQGRPADFVKRLAGLRSFKIATSYSISEDRMLDREFVTRFLAFYIIPLGEYKSDLDGFLNQAMEMVYHMSQEQMDEISYSFNKSMLLATKIFIDDAFRKRYRKSDKRKPINKALFEVWSVLLSRLNNDEASKLVERKDILRENFMKLLNSNDEFNSSISSSTGDRARVRRRFEEIDKLIHLTLS